MASVLLVDDQPEVLQSYRAGLERAGHRVQTANGPADAMDLFMLGTTDIVVSGSEVGGTLGQLLFDRMRAFNPQIEYIVIPIAAEDQIPAQMLRGGAFATVRRGVIMPPELPILVERALQRSQDRESIARIIRLDEKDRTLDDIQTTNPQMRDAIAVARKVAASDSAMLLLGETGTGKRMIARMLHRQSRRRLMPFAMFNSAAVPKEEHEARLFGTASNNDASGIAAHRAGLLEEAQGGTVYIYELSRLDRAVQAKLLMFLQERSITPVGGSKSIPLDVRILCGSRYDLAKFVEEKLFGGDLFYRINTLSILLPSLRDRPRDIALLANEILAQYSDDLGLERRTLSAEAIELLTGHTWKGNVRELRNVLEYALLTSDAIELGADAFPGITDGSTAMPGKIMTEHPTLDELERRYILDTLKACHGSKTETCARLGISTTTLWRKLKQYNIEEEPTT